MALHWEWSNKCGEAVLVQPATSKDEEDRTFSIGLYQGNALLIMLTEYRDNTWNMYSFWADKEHMLSCLGLSKSDDSTNIYEASWSKITKFRFNKNKISAKDLKLICESIIKAFKNITIEVYTE